MQRSAVSLAVCAGIALTAAGVTAQSPAQRLELDRRGETIVLEPYAPNILRVTLSMDDAAAKAGPGYGVIGRPDAAGWSAPAMARRLATLYHSVAANHAAPGYSGRRQEEAPGDADRVAASDA